MWSESLLIFNMADAIISAKVKERLERETSEVDEDA